MAVGGKWIFKGGKWVFERIKSKFKKPVKVEVKKLPQCADYITFCKESHNRWLKLMLNENLINIKEYREGVVEC